MLLRPATASALGVNTRFTGSTCLGWMQSLPWKPKLSAVWAERSRLSASAMSMKTVSMGASNPPTREASTMHARAWASSASAPVQTIPMSRV